MQYTPVPVNFYLPCEQAGTLQTFTYSSESYDDAHEPLTKQAVVYLPFGYDAEPERRYPVLYLMHGGGGNENDFWNVDSDEAPLKNLIDQSIASGRAQKMIVVTPSFNAGDRKNVHAGDACLLTHRFPKELHNDLIPAIDAAFRTVPDRRARSFGGFSMGAEATWSAMAWALGDIGTFLPFSGDFWIIRMRGGRECTKETVDALTASIRESGFSPKDYRVFAFTGDQDIAYEAMDPMIAELKTRGEFFSDANLDYCLKPDGLHRYADVAGYIRLALPKLGVF